MVNRLRDSCILLVVLAVMPPVARAQQPTSSTPTPPVLIGSVENANGQLRLNLTNSDPARELRGAAHISLGNSARQVEAAKLAFTLAPGETRLFPLNSPTASGDQYTLSIYDPAGALIFHKIAPIKRVTDLTPAVTNPTASPTPATTPATSSGKEEVQVRAQLVSKALKPAGGEFEIKPLSEDNSAILIFEIIAPQPIINASFSLSAKGFDQRKPITVQGRVRVEFNLPDELAERKLSYNLIDRAGRLVARGQADLDQLKLEDYVSVSEVKFDRTAYAPGEVARIVLVLQSNSQHSYRLEVAAKEASGNILFRDSRKGAGSGGQSIQEFTLELPREVKGVIILEFKVFGTQTGTLFDSGERQLALTEASSVAARPSP